MENIKIKNLETKYPFIHNYFSSNKIDVSAAKEKSFRQLLDSYSPLKLEEEAIDKEKLIADMHVFVEQMSSFLGIKNDRLSSLTIVAGQDKNGASENFGEITINSSEIVSIVGPTGSGKSRLLADIEVIAQEDTPTRRTILLDGQKNKERSFSSANNKLVAQLSQNMNFVMDLTVEEFLSLHAESRMVTDAEKRIERIINEANQLSGESFGPDTHLTSLSGGQSRALMIADTAILSTSPVVLIDEIENAGVDRKKALQLLLNEDKIVFISTHDPVLALMADKRLVIKNGGIDKVIGTSTEEKGLLNELETIETSMQNMRQKLRSGGRVGAKDLPRYL